MKISRFAFVATAALLFSTLVPAQVSAADSNTFTKTVTVTRPDGTAYAGAQVALEIWDDVTQTRTVTPPVTTGSDGTATITADKTKLYVGVIAEPPVSDTTYALSESYDDVYNNNIDGPVAVQLSVANRRFSVQNADGTPAPAATGIFYPGTGATEVAHSWDAKNVHTLRTGAFGLDLSSTLNLGDYLLQIESATRDTQFTKSYGLKVIQENTIPTIYTTKYNTVALTPDSNGVYNLRFGGSNIHGSLKTPAGANFALPSGSKARLQFLPANSSGNPNYDYESQIDSVLAPINDDGTFNAFVGNPTAGKYFPVVYTSGSTQFASFIGDPIWVNSSLQYATSADGPFLSASAFNLNLRLPSAAGNQTAIKTPTISVKFEFDDTHEAIGGYFYVVSQGGSSYSYNTSSPSGQYTLNLPDGQYFIGEFAYDRRIGDIQGIVVNVVNGIATSVTRPWDPQTQLTPTHGVYVLTASHPNLVVRVVDPAHPERVLTSSTVELYEYQQGGWPNQIARGMFLNGDQVIGVPTDGEHSLYVKPDPSKAAASSDAGFLTEKRYALSYVNGEFVAQGKSGSPITAVNGVLTLPMASANVIGRITDSAGRPLGANNYQIQLNKLHSDCNCYRTSSDVQDRLNQDSYWPGSDGRFGFDVNQTGSYRLVISPMGDSAVGVHTIDFTIDSADLQPSAVKNMGTQVLSNAQLMIQSLLPEGDAFTHGDRGPAYVQISNEDHTYDMGIGMSWDTGRVGISFPTAGVYAIDLHAPEDLSGVTTKRYQAVVTDNNGVLSAVITGQLKDANGVYGLRMGRGNVSGTVVGSDGNPVAINSSTWIDGNLLKLNSLSGQYEYVNDKYSHVGFDGKFSFSVTDPGTYKIQLRPNGLPQYAPTLSESFEITGPDSSVTLPDTTLAQSNVLISVSTATSDIGIHNAWVDIFREGDSSSSGSSTGNSGLAGLNLTEPGTYTITVFPNQDGTNPDATINRYSLVASGTTGHLTLVMTNLATSQVVAKGNDNIYHLKFGKANLTGKVLDALGAPLGNSQYKGVHIDLMKRNNSGQWDYANGFADASIDGTFSLTVSTTGTYKLKFSPRGDQSVATTYTQPFDYDSSNSTFSRDFGSVRLSAPTMKFAVRQQGEIANALYAGIEVRKDNQFVDWGDTGNAGISTINLPGAGTYTFVTHPSGNGSTPGSTAKSYTVIASDNGSGGLNLAIDGLQPDETGLWIFELGAANLRGIVQTPTTDGSHAVQNSFVVAVDALTGREYGEWGSNTNANGRWAMTLPAGTFKIFAHTPWNSSLWGSSDYLGTFVVATNGTVTAPQGVDASNVILHLQNPSWSGTVVDPTDHSIVINTANVCIHSDAQAQYTCSQTDNQGHWAISARSGLTSFDENAEVIISVWNNSNYSEKRVRGKSAVEALLGVYDAQHPVTLLQLSPSTPNLTATVTGNAGPVAGIWVDVQRDGVGFLGGGGTDVNGIAHINIPNPELGFTIGTHLEGNPSYSGIYANKSQNVAAGTCLANQVCSVAISLPAPNFKGQLKYPTVAGVAGPNSTWSWVDVRDATTDQFVGGASTDDNGKFALNLPSSGSYRVMVNPSWQVANSLATTKTYIVTVSGSGEATVYDADTNASVTPQSGLFTLTLGTPSVTGTVLSPSGQAVQNSYVVPIESLTNWQRWDKGGNSNATGNFALALGTGTYKLEANVPWGTSGVAKSAQCVVTISNGVVSNSAGGCVNSDKSVTLSLRAPNFTMSLKHNGEAVPNANVSVQIGNWNAWAQSAPDGTVSLFVDSVAVAAANPNATGSLDVRLFVDPPYGNSDIVRMECLKPSNSAGTGLCANVSSLTIGAEYPQVALGNVEFATPNTIANVKSPSGQAVGAGAWATLWRIDGQNRIWLGGSNSDSNGKVSFNIDSALTTNPNARFALQINAPYQQRQSYAPKTYENLSWADLNNADFNLVLPNLKVSVKQVGGTDASRWANINVFIKDSQGHYNWTANYGTDEQGLAVFNVPGNGTGDEDVRFEINPGGGSVGVRTICDLQVSSSGVATQPSCLDGAAVTLVANVNQIVLSAGNVSGHVYKGNGTTAVQGAIVYAFVEGDSSVMPVQARTAADGSFGMQLDTSKSWKYKIFFVNAPDASEQIGQIIDPVSVSNEQLTAHAPIVANLAVN